MKRTTTIGIVAIALIIVGLALYKFTPIYRGSKEVVIPKELLTPDFIEASVDSAKAEKEKAWAVLKQYLKFAKNHDLEGVASVSYQLSESCKNKATMSDCESRMDNVYNIGKDFEKFYFFGTWYDSKQTILFTDWTYAYGDIASGMSRSIIYFVKDEKGDLKLLSFNPSQNYFIPATASSTREEVNKTLDAGIKDTDRDGLSDTNENCVEDRGTCAETDPNKRDTDGNGFWDSIDTLIYKK